MTKPIVNQTIKNIREGVQGFIEALKKAQQKSYIVYYFKNKYCRKMLDLHIHAIEKESAILIAEYRIRILTDGTGILINGFEEEGKNDA